MTPEELKSIEKCPKCGAERTVGNGIFDDRREYGCGSIPAYERNYNSGEKTLHHVAQTQTCKISELRSEVTRLQAALDGERERCAKICERLDMNEDTARAEILDGAFRGHSHTRSGAFQTAAALIRSGIV